MTKYQIRNYQEGFEEKQANLGVKVTKDWFDFHQTNAENLKRVYSQEDFDPKTRFYAFKNGELVGFLVSKVLPEKENEEKTVHMDFPLADTEHEEVKELLYKHAMNYFEEIGVQKVFVRVSEGWLGTIEQATKYEFKKNELQFLHTEAELKNVKITQAKEIFEHFDPKKDKDGLIELFMKHFNMEKEQAEANLNGIINPEEGQYFQPVIKRDNKIISRGLLFIPKDPTIAIFRPLAPDITKHFDSYLQMITNIAKEKGSEKFRVFLGGRHLKILKLLKARGFEVKNEVYLYEKEL